MSIFYHQLIGTAIIHSGTVSYNQTILILLGHQMQLATPFTPAVLNETCGFPSSNHLSDNAYFLWATTSLTISNWFGTILHVEGMRDSFTIKLSLWKFRD